MAMPIGRGCPLTVCAVHRHPIRSEGSREENRSRCHCAAGIRRDCVSTAGGDGSAERILAAMLDASWLSVFGAVTGAIGTISGVAGAVLAVRGRTPRCTEIGDAPAEQGEKRENTCRGNPCGCPVRQPEQRTAAEFSVKPQNSAWRSGMQRRSNAAGLLPRAARLQGLSSSERSEGA